MTTSVKQQVDGYAAGYDGERVIGVRGLQYTIAQVGEKFGTCISASFPVRKKPTCLPCSELASATYRWRSYVTFFIPVSSVGRQAGPMSTNAATNGNWVGFGIRPFT